MDKRQLMMPGSRRSMAGVSLVEMMIAVTLGLLILAALASIFASSSHSRNEIERNSRQIENGRFAIETLAEDIRLAGFYGELNTAQVVPPGALPDPCSADPVAWKSAIRLHIYGWDEGLGVPPCIPLTNHKPRTDVLMIRRAATCEVGQLGCEPMDANKPYLQVSRCATEQMTTPYDMGYTGGGWGLRLKNCTAAAGLRRYLMRIYYIAMDNGVGQPIPTLKRLDFDGKVYDSQPLVEGIEELNFEYGIDWGPVVGALSAGDGRPESYTADPTSFVDATCGGFCGPLTNWLNAMTVRIHLLSRNIDPSPDYVDQKIYTLGTTQNGSSYDVTPGGSYRRHVYSSLVRVVNAAQRRETPE